VIASTESNKTEAGTYRIAPSAFAEFENIRSLSRLSRKTFLKSKASTQRHGSQLSGTGACAPHFGEILQGAFERHSDKGSQIVRGLVSLHAPNAPGSVARFVLNPFSVGDFTTHPKRTGIEVTPGHYTKSAIAARIALDAMGLHGIGGVLNIETFVPDGGGMGSSTSGAVASVRAVVDAVSSFSNKRFSLPPHLQAQISVASESASDAIMYDPANTTVLFAHREGEVIKVLGGPLPRMAVLGFDTATSGGLQTDSLPRARYSPEQIGDFGCAIAMLEVAIADQSVELVGQVATLSSEISQTAMANPLHKPKFAELKAIRRASGAAGIVVAHSGTVAGLIFDPTSSDINAQIDSASHALDGLEFGNRRLFTTPY